MLRSYLCLTSLAFALSTPTHAQMFDDDIISVNGSRLNQTETEIGSSVSIITSDDIEKLGFDFAVDAIATAPGVTVSQNGALGGQAAIRIRGASSEQTLTLIDGIPVNDTSSPGGGFDFGRLDTNNIERIEILKGPQSTLWGSDAIGGIINIITKRANKGISAEGFAEIGSYETYRGGGAINGANNVGDIRLAITGITSDGISKADRNNGNTERDGYDAYTLSGRGGLDIGLARFDFSALYTDANTDFDSFIFGAQGNVGDGDESAESQELSGHLSLTLPLLDDRLENKLMLGYSEIDRQNFAGSTPSFGAEGDRQIFRYQGTAHINSHNKIAFGYEHEKTDVGQDDSSIDSVFTLYEAKPLAVLTLTGGIRLDDHSVFGSETTGRIAAAYNPTERATFRASWAQGFKAPTIFQTTFLCCGANAANQDLRPERAEAFDLGFDIRTRDDRGSWGITLFKQDIDDLITFSFGIGGFENIAEAKSEGLEVFGEYAITDWINLGVNYTYTDARDGDGQHLLRVPEHSGDITLSVNSNGPFSGAALLRYSGKQEDSTGQIDDWMRLDLNGSYAVNERFEIYGRLENVLDANYQQVLGYGTPGLSGSLGLRVKY